MLAIEEYSEVITRTYRLRCARLQHVGAYSLITYISNNCADLINVWHFADLIDIKWFYKSISRKYTFRVFIIFLLNKLLFYLSLRMKWCISEHFSLCCDRIKR